MTNKIRKPLLCTRCRHARSQHGWGVKARNQPCYAPDPQRYGRCSCPRYGRPILKSIWGWVTRG